MAFYVDTSALVKLVVAEPETAALRTWMSGRTPPRPTAWWSSPRGDAARRPGGAGVGRLARVADLGLTRGGLWFTDA